MKDIYVIDECFKRKTFENLLKSDIDECFKRKTFENLLKSDIYAKCRRMEKADVYEWVCNDELKIQQLQQERDKYKSIVDSMRDFLVKEISRMDDLMNKGKPKPYGTEKQYYQTCKCRYVDVLTKIQELEEGDNK